MAKTERLFEMYNFIKEYPNLTVEDLSHLCNVSVRGIYRYRKTLVKMGFPVKCVKGQYRIENGTRELLSKQDGDRLELIKEFVETALAHEKDPRRKRDGRDILSWIDSLLPQTAGRISVLSTSADQMDHDGTLTIGHASRPEPINPLRVHESISVNLLELIFSNLVKFDSSGSPVPDLAIKWGVSDDGLIWSFLLREDVRFHDGHPLAADDVEFTYRRLMDGPMAERMWVVDSVGVRGNNVFWIRLKHPYAALLQRLNRAIAPKHLLCNSDLTDASFGRHPIGSGPFRFSDWSKDDIITLVRNPDYFEVGRPTIDRLIFRRYEERTESVEAITTGRIDIALDLVADDLLFLKPFHTLAVHDNTYYALLMKISSPIFRDLRVRQAARYGIDVRSILQEQLKERGTLTTGPFPPGSWASNGDVANETGRPHDAEKLLLESGWVRGKRFLEKNGQSLRIAVGVVSGFDTIERIAVAVKTQLVKIGIDVELLYLDNVAEGSQCDAILTKIASGADPDCAYRYWHSESRDYNLIGYSNSEVDQLLEEGRSRPKIHDRQPIYQRIHKLIHDDCPGVFIASGYSFVGSRYISDATFSSQLQFISSMKDWQILPIAGEGRQAESLHAVS